MFQLPVSRMEVTLRPPGGTEDLLLTESPSLDTSLAIELVRRIARPTGSAEIDWGQLFVADLEALLLVLRQGVFGDVIRASKVCAAPACRARIEVSFRISEYLEHYKPRFPQKWKSADDGWFSLEGHSVKFRLPRVGDQLAAATDLERGLIRRCVVPADVPWRWRHRVERAMESLAPGLSRTLGAKCPECQEETHFFFDVQRFVLEELRDQALFVFRDVHLLALHYKWSESEILALPQWRRIQYAELLGQDGRGN